MTLVKFNRPQRGNAPVMSTLFDELFNSFPAVGDFSTAKNLPAVNISECETSFSIELSTPGFEKAELNVEIEDNQLVISGEKKTNSETKEKNYARKEFSYLNFKRSFNLPENINADEISGNYENGVLHIELPKQRIEQKANKKIDLK